MISREKGRGPMNRFRGMIRNTNRRRRRRRWESLRRKEEKDWLIFFCGCFYHQSLLFFFCFLYAVGGSFNWIIEKNKGGRILYLEDLSTGVKQKTSLFAREKWGLFFFGFPTVELSQASVWIWEIIPFNKDEKCICLSFSNF